MGWGRRGGKGVEGVEGVSAHHLVVVHVLLAGRVGSEGAGDDAVLLFIVRSGHVLSNDVSDLRQQLCHLQPQLGCAGGERVAYAKPDTNTNGNQEIRLRVR